MRSPSNRGEPAHTDAFADRSGCRRTRVIVELDDRTVAIRRGLTCANDFAGRPHRRLTSVRNVSSPAETRGFAEDCLTIYG